jgi:hypothetical protein
VAFAGTGLAVFVRTACLPRRTDKPFAFVRRTISGCGSGTGSWMRRTRNGDELIDAPPGAFVLTAAHAARS